MKNLLYLALILSFLFLQASRSLGEEPDRKNRALWESMSREEKQRVIERYRELKSYPPERQGRIRRNYEIYNELLPGERQLLKERFHIYKGLQPDRKAGIDARLKRMDSLPPQRREDVVRKYNRLKGRPAEERMRFMEHTGFWRNLNDQERETYRKLMFPHE